MSKGSKRRPETGDAYRNNWDRIFNKRKDMIEIYGKTRCSFCNSAKALAESKGRDYKYYLLDADYTEEEFFEKFPGARTFPQIVVEGKAIGGFQELQQVLKG